MNMLQLIAPELSLGLNQMQNALAFLPKEGPSPSSPATAKKEREK